MGERLSGHGLVTAVEGRGSNEHADSSQRAHQATSGYFDFQRREVRVRGQDERLLIGDSAIRGAAVLMASSSSAKIAFGVASGVHQDEGGRWSFVACVAGSNTQTGHTVADFSKRHSLRQATVKFAVKSKCSIAE